MSKNFCPRCRRLVFQPEEKCAFGKVWHSFCFSCYICNKLLDCTNAQIAKEELFCIDCLFRLGREEDNDEDDQCPSERCIRSISSRAKSIDYLQAKFVPSNVQSSLKTNEVIYPCTIPVPHSIAAWYNRQHRRRLPPTKQLFCVPSCVSCNSGYKRAQESECTCSPSSSPVNKEIRPRTASEASVKCKRTVSFERSKIAERPKSPQRCPSKISASTSVSNHINECSELKPKRMCYPIKVDCVCANFKPISVIKQALHECVLASSESKYCCLDTGNVKGGKFYGSRILLGGGLDCRRCGRKVYFAEKFTVPGAVYHDTCFCCLDCRKPLEVTTVYSTQGDIYCKLCYIRNFGPVGYGYGIGGGVLLSPTP